MEVDVIVTRNPNRQADDGMSAISLGEWLEFVRQDPDLRHRTDPRLGRNPRTGASIEIAVGEGTSEMLFGEDAEGFLTFDSGELVGRIYVFESGDNTMRDKVAHVARELRAVILDGERQETLDW